MITRPDFRSPAAIIAVSALLLAGCDGDRPAAPPAVAVATGATPERLMLTRGALSDITARVIPGSPGLAASAELTQAIARVDLALARDDATTLQSALANADRAVASLAATDGADAAELDAIRLALADARRIVP